MSSLRAVICFVDNQQEYPSDEFLGWTHLGN